MVKAEKFSVCLTNDFIFKGNSVLAEGQVAHFEAQIEPIHDPSLKIEFFHNGKPLKQVNLKFN